MSTRNVFTEPKFVLTLAAAAVAAVGAAGVYYSRKVTGNTAQLEGIPEPGDLIIATWGDEAPPGWTSINGIDGAYWHIWTGDEAWPLEVQWAQFRSNLGGEPYQV